MRGWRDDDGPPESLERRYRATVYQVLAVPPFTLRIGRRSERLQRLHARRGVHASAFLTAWNPRSRRVGRARNEAAQRRLLATLQRRGRTLLRAVAAAPDGRWAEDSVLVFGIGRDEACALARACGQNALLIAGADATPRLQWVERAATATSAAPRGHGAQPPTGSRPSGR